MMIYLDNCCFNRPFDDQSQIRVRIEAEAKLKVQEEIRSGIFKLVWSYILDYENSKNPFFERREQIARWRGYSIEEVHEDNEVLSLSHMLNEKGLKTIDALHVACAIRVKADYFLTTDDGVLKKAVLVNEIKITDPIGFIKEVSL